MLRSLKRRLRENRAFYFSVGRVFGFYRNSIMRCARLFRGYDDNLVVFSSLYQRSYSDSPRYISEALHAVRPQVKIVWLFDVPETARERFDIPDYVQIYNTIERRGVSALARARVVVDNAGKRFYLKFPGKGQFYLQTWHGDRAFKKIGYDNVGAHLRMPEEDASAIMVGSEFGAAIIPKALHCKGDIIRCGIPRNDILVRNDPTERETIRSRLGLNKDTPRVLLYAPTFRDSDMQNNRQQEVPVDLSRALDTLERTTGERWICLVRAHYFVSELALDECSDPRLISVTAYAEMAELLLVADALLSDYSSCASDYVLLRRPIYLYLNDLEKYQSRDRALYVPMTEYGYWIARTPEELDHLIEQTTPERAAQNCDRIMAYYGMHETGHATEAAVDYIISKLDGQGGSSK